MGSMGVVEVVGVVGATETGVIEEVAEGERCSEGIERGSSPSSSSRGVGSQSAT
jgi:hypothetical protein